MMHFLKTDNMRSITCSITEQTDISDIINVIRSINFNDVRTLKLNRSLSIDPRRNSCSTKDSMSLNLHVNLCRLKHL